ncbi:MAG: FAD-binding oxidoreductase [Acidobacteria bacterium]|nr:FAD-binding oxidoreductase [Acidobacteriota bacterium]
MNSSSLTQSQQALEQLAAIAGAGFVRTSDTGTIAVSPANTQQVSAILAFASKHRLTVTPQGGGTKQLWGQGATPHIYLSLTRLNKVIEHPWQDLTCTVQAGCTWSSLQQTLAQHGQFVALDPLFSDRATVGGILATNDSGALRQRYGSLRDLVIGMTLVLPDGTIARTGGKVVKNVAGYDLSKLLTGSLGTLAVITEANFRLHPLPQYERSFTIAAALASHLAPLLADLRASHLLTQSLQLRRSVAEARLDICLNAHPEAHQHAILEQMAKQQGFTLEESPAAIWREREMIFATGATVLRISTLPTHACSLVDQLQTLQPSIEAVSVSQAIGLHNVALRGSPEAVASTITQLRTDAQNTVTVLQAAPGVEAQPFVINPSVQSLMQSVKRNFDPDGVLNPGKFFAGA